MARCLWRCKTRGRRARTLNAASNLALPTEIGLDRKTAATNQLVAALEMFLAARYDCAITLAGAAEGMVEGTGPMFGRMKSEVPEELKSVVGRTDKERVSYWNTLRDWLKHHNSDMPNQIVIERYDAELMIARAITKIDPHPSTLSPDQFRLLKRFYELMLTDMPRG
jgi:hypothetical protein